MKILVLTNSLSGLISFRKEVIKSFIDKGHSVYIAAPESNRSEELKDIGARVLITPVDRRGTNPFHDFTLLLSYIKLLRLIRPDVVLTYTIKPNVYGGLACRLTGIPQIANITGLGTSLENVGLLQRISRSLYKFGLLKAKTVFFQNTGNLNYCISSGIVKPKQIKLLPGSGVNLQQFHVFDYPEDSVIRFLYIGRLMQAKGTDELLWVAKQIKQEHFNIEFHIVGSYEDNYQKVVEEYINDGIVVFHGAKDDVRPYIRDCSCLIHPSHHEGMSNVILEASACGRPVITTDICGCREAVDDGITGFLALPRDSKDLLLKVKRFAGLSLNDRKNMGIAARSKVEKSFDRNIVIESYLDEINSIQ